MEFILIIIFIGWLYTLMDDSSTTQRDEDEFNEWLNESFKNNNKSFSYEDPILALKRELYTKSKYVKHTKYAKEKRKEYNKTILKEA